MFVYFTFMDSGMKKIYAISTTFSSGITYFDNNLLYEVSFYFKNYIFNCFIS